MKQALVTAALIIGMSIAVLGLLWRGRCHETVVHEYSSPQGGYVAVHKETDCGPSTLIATEVDVKRSGEGGETVNVLLYEGTDPMDLRWQSEEKLAIELPEKVVIIKRRPAWDGLQIHVSRIESSEAKAAESAPSP